MSGSLIRIIFSLNFSYLQIRKGRSRKATFDDKDDKDQAARSHGFSGQNRRCCYESAVGEIVLAGIARHNINRRYYRHGEEYEFTIYSSPRLERLANLCIVRFSYCSQPTRPQIFGGSPGNGFDSGGGSGSFFNGGRNTVSRSLFTLPLPSVSLPGDSSSRSRYHIPCSRCALVNILSLGRTGRRGS
jgi:hypothetical protein